MIHVLLRSGPYMLLTITFVERSVSQTSQIIHEVQ